MTRSSVARRVLAAAVVLGLANAAMAASPRAPGGTLLVGAPSFDFIDPALVPDPITTGSCGTCTTAMWAIADATCAPLLRYPVTVPPAADYRLVPEGATGYPTHSRDGQTYTFTIAKGLRFSTGAPLTAANYVRAFERVLSPAMRSPAARYFQEVAGVRASGNQLIVRLTKSVPDFPARMTVPYLCPVPTDLPIAPEGVGAPLPGSGPFYVAEFVRGTSVVLKRNPYYRGTRAHHVDQIVVQIGDTEEANARKVGAGQVDVDLSGGGAAGIAVQDEIVPKYGINKQQFFSIHSADMFYLLMNTERPLFKNNPKLRQAVNFALDRTALVAVGGAVNGLRTDSYVPPGLPGYRDVHPYPVKYPDLPKARALANGHTRGGKAVLYVSDNPQISGALAHAQIIQYNLKQIGIDVEIKQFPTTIRNTKIATRGEPFDLAHIRYLVNWVDPYQYVRLLLDGRTIRPTDNINRSYFNSPHYNKLIDQAEQLYGQARYDAYGKLALDIARNEAPMAAFINRNTRIFVSSRVGCVRAIGVAAHGVDLAGLCLR